MADFTELTPDPSTTFTPPGDIGWRDYFLRQQAFLQSVTKQVNPWNAGSVPYVTANGYLSTNATLTVAALNALVAAGTGTVVDTTIARTLSITDNGKWIHFTNAAAITLSMAASLGEFKCWVLQEGAGDITFSANGQTMTVAGGFTKTAYVGAPALIISRTSGTFWISGTLA